MAHQIAEGSDEARDRMIRSNLRLVVSIAKNYTRRGMSLLDLIEEGNLGLLKGVMRFSPDQGCKFSTYASWWIKQTIRRALINKVKSVRVPAYMVEILTRWKKTSAEMTQALGREPSPEEIGTALDLPAPKINAIRQALSAAAPTGRGGNSDEILDIEEQLATVPSREESGRGNLDEYDREALSHAIEYALTDRERKIIELRYGLGEEESLTLETIGQRIGLTRERVRQIENQALHKLELFMVQKDEQDARKRQFLRRKRADAKRLGLPMPMPNQDAPAPARGKRRERPKGETARLRRKPEEPKGEGPPGPANPRPG